MHEARLHGADRLLESLHEVVNSLARDRRSTFGATYQEATGALVCVVTDGAGSPKK